MHVVISLCISSLCAADIAIDIVIASLFVMIFLDHRILVFSCAVDAVCDIFV